MVTLDDLLKTLKRVDGKDIGDRIIQEVYEAAKNPILKSYVSARWTKDNKLILEISTTYIVEGIINKNELPPIYNFSIKKLPLLFEDAIIRSVKRYFNEIEVSRVYDVEVYDRVGIRMDYEMKVLGKDVLFQIYGKPDFIIYCYPKKNYEFLKPLLYIFEIKTVNVKNKKDVNKEEKMYEKGVLQTLIYKILLEDALKNSFQEGLPYFLKNKSIKDIKIKPYLLLIKYSLKFPYKYFLRNIVRYWKNLSKNVEIYEVDSKLTKNVKREMMELFRKIARNVIKKSERRKRDLLSILRKSIVNNLRNL